MVMKICGLCVSKRHWSQHSVFSTWPKSVAIYNWYQNLILHFFFIFFAVLYRNNHHVQCTWFLFSLNISKQWIYLQCVVTIYTKSLAHIYNCKSKCVDLFLLDQCVINLVYVCLSCLKVIGRYATWRCAYSWMIFFFTASKGCLIILFFNFFKEML